MNEIMSVINNYLKLKDEFKPYNKENLYKVFTLFEDEAEELVDITDVIGTKIDKIAIHGYSETQATIETMYDEEENLLNEIADVLLTTARLIKEFKLEEPLIEMMEYKYHRQCIREEKKKNEGLK